MILAGSFVAQKAEGQVKALKKNRRCAAGVFEREVFV